MKKNKLLVTGVAGYYAKVDKARDVLGW